MGKNAVKVRAMNTTQIKQTLDEQGVCLLPGFFTAKEIKMFCDEAEHLWQTQEQRVAQNLRLGLRVDQQGNTVLDRIDPVEDISEVFFQLNRHPKLLEIIESVFGKKALVMKEKLIYKFPGTSGFGAHRDEPYFGVSGVPGEQMLSVAIALDAARRQNGNMEFFPTLTRMAVAAEKNEPRDVAPEALINIKPFSPELNAGDVVIFNGLIPHQSGVNTGTQSRRTYTITYAPDSYPECRNNYYRIRYQQMQQERQGKFAGPFFVK